MDVWTKIKGSCQPRVRLGPRRIHATGPKRGTHLLVVPDSEHQVSRHDSVSVVVPRGVSGELEDLGGLR